MGKQLVFRPAADAEFNEAALWYEEQRQGLGFEFIDQIQGVLDKIQDNPLQYAIALQDIREALVSRFPFAVYYRVKIDRLIILAVFHCSRDPQIWQSRN
jgi:plasmid stabilization system protein ParE